MFECVVCVKHYSVVGVWESRCFEWDEWDWYPVNCDIKVTNRNVIMWEMCRILCCPNYQYKCIFAYFNVIEFYYIICFRWFLQCLISNSSLHTDIFIEWWINLWSQIAVHFAVTAVSLKFCISSVCLKSSRPLAFWFSQGEMHFYSYTCKGNVP